MVSPLSRRSKGLGIVGEGEREGEAMRTPGENGRLINFSLVIGTGDC